jgi:hypothetical protein
MPPDLLHIELLDLDGLTLIAEAERLAALTRALLLCADDAERRELRMIDAWLRPYRGGPLQ